MDNFRDDVTLRFHIIDIRFHSNVVAVTFYAYASNRMGRTELMRRIRGVAS
jgi:hypothetical protein